MANTSDFRNGLIFEHKGRLWKILEFLHVKPGKGPAFVRTKLKNIKTAQVIDETFRSGEKINVIKIEARDYTYLFNTIYTIFVKLMICVKLLIYIQICEIKIILNYFILMIC